MCRLKRAMYGLKQAPHAWYTWIDSYFTRLGFAKSEADENLYQIVVGWDIKFNEVKAMKLLLERELHLHVEEELLVPKDEPLDVDQPQEEDYGVEESTHAEPNIRMGRRRTIEAKRLKLDATQNVGVPTSQRRQRQSLD